MKMLMSGPTPDLLTWNLHFKTAHPGGWGTLLSSLPPATPHSKALV